MSSERSEARRKLRECDGLVDALIYIVQSEIGQKDLDSKVPQRDWCWERVSLHGVHLALLDQGVSGTQPPVWGRNVGLPTGAWLCHSSPHHCPLARGFLISLDLEFSFSFKLKAGPDPCLQIWSTAPECSHSLSQTLWFSPQLVENCVCLLRNLSYQVHREIPHAERYQETPLVPANNAAPHNASCFGAKKGKGLCASSSREGRERNRVRS